MRMLVWKALWRSKCSDTQCEIRRDGWSPWFGLLHNHMPRVLKIHHTDVPTILALFCWWWCILYIWSIRCKQIPYISISPPLASTFPLLLLLLFYQLHLCPNFSTTNSRHHTRSCSCFSPTTTLWGWECAAGWGHQVHIMVKWGSEPLSPGS